MEYKFLSYESFLYDLLSKTFHCESMNIVVDDSIEINEKYMVKILELLSVKFGIKFSLNNESVKFVKATVRNNVQLNEKSIGFNF